MYKVSAILRKRDLINTFIHHWGKFQALQTMIN